jgi:hypothetical protein
MDGDLARKTGALRAARQLNPDRRNTPMSPQEPPLACILEAIPEAERSAHVTLASELFGQRVQERQDMPHGYAFRFSPDTLAELARFLTNERRCCPFLSFEIAIASSGGPVWLRITGPEGTREFLATELPGVRCARTRSAKLEESAPQKRP